MKKYVITDPCYILSEEDWKKCVEYAEKTVEEDKVEWSYIFKTAVETALTKFTNSSSWVKDTGFGDWTNILYGPNKDGYGEFCADAGMVCVCEVTDKVSAALEEIQNKKCFAIFEAEGPISVNFDTSDSNWTVVNIKDSAGNTWITMEPDKDEDEEEYWWQK